jgi:hypothetical protein
MQNKIIKESVRESTIVYFWLSLDKAMKSNILFLLLLFLFCIFQGLQAQFYSTGEPPASLTWKQIRTPHFRIVFPTSLYQDANLLANSLEYHKTATESTYTWNVRKFQVVMHGSSIRSNGYVSWAPKRMEIVPVTPQNSYAQDWISQLALHEYRHVVQLDKLNQGFTKGLSLFTGEIAVGGISSLIPLWFYEGDAVWNETRMSATGRGRVAGFEMPLRTLILQNRRVYTYDKAVFGSFRDYVPDHYQYGYQLVSYGFAKYGDEFWSSALTYVARNPYMIWPLAFYLKKSTGFNKTKLYNRVIDSLKYMYAKQEKQVTYINYLHLSPVTNRSYTNYILPGALDQNTYLALETGFNRPDRFVVFDTTGRVETLFYPGITPGYKCDISGNCLVWEEWSNDPRWERRDYSEIRLYRLDTHKSKYLSRKSRYFSPDFSPDGKRLAVVETDASNACLLTILDVSDGHVLKRIPVSGRKALQMPDWLDNNTILAITVSSSGKQIEKLDLTTENWSVVMPNTYYDIAEILHFKEYVLFRSSFSGIDNIYAYHISTHKTFQVTWSRYGAYYPSVTIDSAMLLFSEYKPGGFAIARARLDTNKWLEIPEPETPSGLWPAAKQWTGVPQQISDDESIMNYPVSNYQKARNIFRFHSWMPLYTSLDDYSSDLTELRLYPGFIIFSQNLLSTFISSVGYGFMNGHHILSPSVSWRGWYPVIELKGQVGGPARSYPLPEGMMRPEDAGPYIEYKINAYVPLIFNRGSSVSFVQPGMEYQRSNTFYAEKNELRRGIDYLHYKLYLSNYKRKAYRDIYPRFGQFLALAYTQTPAEKKHFGNMIYAAGGLFLPGLLLHHNLMISTALQLQRPERYYIPINRIEFPRGYSSAVSRQLTTLKIDYTFPVVYPDWALGPVCYLKRIRLNFFHDLAYGKDVIASNSKGANKYTGYYQSFGTEITLDLHLIRIIFPMSVGLRIGYKPEGRSAFLETMFSISTGIF